MKMSYRINGEVLHLFTHGVLIPKKSLQVVVHLPQQDQSIIRFGVQGLSPMDLELSTEEAAKTLLELENWLASSESTVQPINTSKQQDLDEFGLPTEPQNAEELELFLQGSKSFEDAMKIFNRKQDDHDLKQPPISSATNKETIDHKRVFSSHMFDLSD